jgi:hypothetical protein
LTRTLTADLGTPVTVSGAPAAGEAEAEPQAATRPRRTRKAPVVEPETEPSADSEETPE